MELVLEIGKSLILEVLQVAIGCLIGYVIFRGLMGKEHTVKELNNEKVLGIILASLLGLILPLGIFGIIPIVLACLLVGLKLYMIIPMLGANFVFNTLVPFTDVGFSWKTGITRVIVAFIVGVASGFVIMLLKVDGEKIIKLDQSEKLMGKAESTKNYFTWLNQYLYLAGFFILGGVILDVIFKTYFFYDVVNTVNISAISASVFSIVKGYDITTSIFLINMVLFNSVMSLKTLSAVLMLFKWKGALSYYIYFGLWVCILSVVNILA